jgi:WXG100 family type VII secretion target
MTTTAGQGQDIDPQLVLATATEMDTFVGTVSGRLSSISNEIEGLKAHYQGRGALAFQMAMLNWNEAGGRLTKTIVDYANMVRLGGKQHAAGDQQTADLYPHI